MTKLLVISLPIKLCKSKSLKKFKISNKKINMKKTNKDKNYLIRLPTLV